MKAVVIDGFTKVCGKCGEKVVFAKGTGKMFCGASESYEQWDTVKYNFCPRCGEKVDPDDDEELDDFPSDNLIYDLIQGDDR